MQKISFFHNKAGGSWLRRIFESPVSAEKLCPLIDAKSITAPALMRREGTSRSDPSVCADIYPSSGIISHAQNGEDILLWRALCAIEEGFYVDVGAQDPTCDSVTRAFYDRGWRGINIEPVKNYFDKLCLERPRDITLQVAVGDRVGSGTLYEFPNTGLSTLVEEVAFGHRARGFGEDSASRAHRNASQRLGKICEGRSPLPQNRRGRL